MKTGSMDYWINGLLAAKSSLPLVADVCPFIHSRLTLVKGPAAFSSIQLSNDPLIQSGGGPC